MFNLGLVYLCQNCKIGADFVESVASTTYWLDIISRYLKRCTEPETKMGTIFPHGKATVYLREICPGSLTVSQKCTYLISGECFTEIYLLKMYAKDFQNADKL